jgi:hypothetical protein
MSLLKLAEHVGADLGMAVALHSICDKWTSGELRVWQRHAKELGAKFHEPFGEYQKAPPSLLVELQARSLSLRQVFQCSESGIYVGNNEVLYLFASRADAGQIWPWPGGQPTLPPGRRNPRGANAKIDWEQVLIEAAGFIIEKGLPESQAKLVEHITIWLGDGAPGETQIKAHIAPLWRRAIAAAGR